MELSTTDIVSNTIVNETTKRGLNLVLAKEIVFRCYIQRIAMNKYRYNPQFPKISDFSPENYKVWFFKKIDNLNNSIYTTWKDIEEYSIVCVGELKDNNVITISSQTGMESDLSQEEAFNCPASGYLFSSLYSGDSYIKKDWNYDMYYVDPLACVTTNGYSSCDPAYNIASGISGHELFNRKYWQTNYSFTSGYDKTEYIMYNISRHMLPEDCAAVMTSDCRFKTVPRGDKYEALVITYGDENLPVIYNELHRPNRFINGYINIQWSPQGIITVK